MVETHREYLDRTTADGQQQIRQLMYGCRRQLAWLTFISEFEDGLIVNFPSGHSVARDLDLQRLIRDKKVTMVRRRSAGHVRRTYLVITKKGRTYI